MTTEQLAKKLERISHGPLPCLDDDETLREAAARLRELTEQVLEHTITTVELNGVPVSAPCAIESACQYSTHARALAAYDAAATRYLARVRSGEYARHNTEAELEACLNRTA